MRRFVVKVECPHCGEFTTYRFRQEALNERKHHLTYTPGPPVHSVPAHCVHCLEDYHLLTRTINTYRYKRAEGDEGLEFGFSRDKEIDLPATGQWEEV